MTIRERVAELTQGCRSQVELDRVVANGGLQTLMAEFPAQRSEVLYEWDNRKLTVGGRMVVED